MKRAIIKFIKGILLITVLAVSVIFTIYTLAWFSITKEIEAYMNVIWHDKAFVIKGDMPKMSGYPLVPHADFSGQIEHESGLIISTPMLHHKGFPVSSQIQSFEAPDGIKISASFLERDLNIEYAYLQVRMPRAFPSSNKKEDLKIWQERNDPFIVQQIILQAGHIYAHGSGTLTLDTNLQISADVNARVMGMDRLLDELAKEQGEKTIAMARSMFNMMSKTDEKTGERYFETTLKIQDKGVFFGPMRITGLPELKWK